MGSFGNQLRQVFRRLGRTPMFTAVTLITLAVGIGANTAIFSVIESVVLEPLAYPHSEQLVDVSHTAPGLNIKNVGASPSNYFIYREQSRTIQDIGMYQGNSVSVTGVAEPEQVSALNVTDGMLPLLGVPPAIGRGFSREDDTPSGPNVVMITYGYWQRKFGGDPSVIGRSITVDGKSQQIIGVMPKTFHFLDRTDPGMFLPLKVDRAKVVLGNFSFQAVARLKPGATIADLNADVARMLPIVFHSFPPFPGVSLKQFEDVHMGPNLSPLKQFVIGDVSKLLWVLMGAIGLVLLIACANVANLLLVRVEGRRQELGIRSALGASRGRITAELLFESTVLGLLGSALGLALAYGGLRVLVAMAPDGLPRVDEIGIHAPVLLFTLVVSLLASMLFGSVPVLKFSGASLATGLREGGRTLSQSRERHRARSTLVIVQVALALVLLICSGLMIRTFRALTHVQPGFVRPAEVQTFGLSITETEVPDSEPVIRMFEAIQHKIEAIPGVSAVALSTSIPLDGNRSSDPIFPQDHPYAEGQLPPLRRFKFVAPGFLATLGTPLIAGREFTWTDVYNRAPVALVSENLAREYWNDPVNAIGKRIRAISPQDWTEIVGVVSNVYDDGVDQDPSSSVYWPVLMKNFEGKDNFVSRGLSVAIRSPRAGSQTLMRDVQQAVWSVDANLPLAGAHTLDYYYQKSMARTSFTLVMLAVAGGMALLLGTIGLYGVIAYSVSQRTREIGIRMALGAQQGELTKMFVRHGLTLAGIGVVCGLVAAFALMRLLSSLLFHVSPVDPLTYAAVSAGLVAAAMLASYIPSRRAANIDPVEALRAE
jgi:putative ABC transport system permease protein